MEHAEKVKRAATGSLLKLLLKWLGIPVIIGIFLFGIVLIAALIYQNESESSKSGVIGGAPSKMALGMIPKQFMPIYQAAGKMYGVPWNLLAAHHKVETEFSTIKVMVSPVGAQGHMQFMPLTWIGWSYPGGTRLGNAGIPKEILTNPKMIKKYGGYGVDGNKDGKADPYNIEDSIYSAANYLAANGAKDGNLKKAVFAYNHADWYVNEVLEYAKTFANMEKQSVPVNGSGGVVWPVPFTDKITSPFGMRMHPIKKTAKFHNGIDIAAAGVNGKPVVSFTDGKVTYSGFIGGYGNAVIISHSKGYESLYGHLSSLAVKVGQQVKAGETVGAVGSTGLSTGPHLHFTVNKDGNAIDPMSFFDK